MNKHTMKKISAAVLLAVAAMSANAVDVDSTPQESTAQTPDTWPNFDRIKVHGKTGHGITRQLLRTKGADLTASDDDHDSQLIDTSAMTHEEATAAIANALENNKTIIVDGDDTVAASKQLAKIMNEAVGFSMAGVTAYVIRKNSDGKTTVTPLQSVNTNTGVRKIDQLDNFFAPRHH